MGMTFFSFSLLSWRVKLGQLLLRYEPLKTCAAHRVKQTPHTAALVKFTLFTSFSFSLALSLALPSPSILFLCKTNNLSQTHTTLPEGISPGAGAGGRERDGGVMCRTKHSLSLWSVSVVLWWEGDDVSTPTATLSLSLFGLISYALATVKSSRLIFTCPFTAGTQ